MGSNMAKRLSGSGHRVVIYNRTEEKTKALVDEDNKLVPSFSLKDLASKLKAKPRAVWVMVPAGEPTRKMVERVASVLSEGDVVIDGGNSHYTDTIKNAELANKKGVHFVDVGTSGGVWGLKEGYSLMVGGEEDVVGRLTPIFEALAPGKERGWGRVGAVGAGHFVKMVHNGIEYGMMEAYAEGFEVLRAKSEYRLDLHSIAEIWRYGSVVRSWLLDLAASSLEKDQDLTGIEAWVDDSGEGRWTVKEAIDENVPAPVITLSLLMRIASRQDERYADKLLAALRNQFGGHEVKKEGERKGGAGRVGQETDK
jgi:6-phosphogluconate dehydrogenase